MQDRKAIVGGGVCFIVGALAFVGVFSYLAAKFDYPAILHGNAAEVLPRLLGGDVRMRAAWALYSFLPLLLVPAAVGVRSICAASRARMTLALLLGSLGAFAMCLGLMRWPSIHWALAEAWPNASAETQVGLAALFRGLNLYLGNYVGEFFGEVALAAFFLLSGLSMLDEARLPKWLGWVGVVFSLLFAVGAFRNVTAAVQAIADLDNYLLPLWMIVLGVAMIRFAKRRQIAMTGTESH